MRKRPIRLFLFHNIFSLFDAEQQKRENNNLPLTYSSQNNRNSIPHLTQLRLFGMLRLIRQLSSSTTPQSSRSYQIECEMDGPN